MSGHAVSIAKPVECVENRVVAHRFVFIIGSGERESAIARKQLERPQYFHRST